jgi:hypothetical protein
MTTGRTNEAARPPQPFQVVQAVCISPEPSPKLPKRLGVVGAGQRTFHCPRLVELRLNGYPRAPLSPTGGIWCCFPAVFGHRGGPGDGAVTPQAGRPTRSQPVPHVPQLAARRPAIVATARATQIARPQPGLSQRIPRPAAMAGACGSGIAVAAVIGSATESSGRLQVTSAFVQRAVTS